MSTLAASSFPPPASQRWAYAQEALRNSFNRLSAASDPESASEVPSDSPGVMANFSAASQRLASGLESGEGDAPADASAAFAQAQSILSRMAELKELTEGATEEDRSAYDGEFAQLQSDLLALGEQLGDGNPLVHTAGGGALEIDDTLPPASPAPAHSFQEDFSTTDNWVSTYGSLSAEGGTFFPNASGGFGAVESAQEFSGAFELTFSLFLPGAADSLDLSIGGTALSHLADSENTTKWSEHSVRIVYDGVDRAATYLDGAEDPVDVREGLGELSGTLGLANLGEGSARLRDLTLRTIDAGVAAEVVRMAAAHETAETTHLEAVTEAETLEEIKLEEITQAMEEIADYQAENLPPVVTNDPFGLKEVDEPEPVDPERRLAELAQAEEDTEQIRQDILVDSTEAFLAQANIPESAALYLLV